MVLSRIRNSFNRTYEFLLANAALCIGSGTVDLDPTEPSREFSKDQSRVSVAVDPNEFSLLSYQGEPRVRNCGGNPPEDEEDPQRPYRG